MPALCSPLKGVGVLGHPAFAAAAAESNQSPRWYICTGLVWTPPVASGTTAGGSGNSFGAGVKPGEIMKVSLLKRPTKLPTPVPVESVLMSPIYQEAPKGAMGI